MHVSTAAVYDRSPSTGDIDESSALARDDSGAYSVTKRDADRALADVDGLTRILVRPPCILGAGETSVWNTLRPRQIRDDESARGWGWSPRVGLTEALEEIAAGLRSA